MHRHSDHELLWAIDGVLEVRTPETVYTVPSGVSLWIPSFVPHEVTARSGTELSCTWLVASDVTGLDRVVALSTPPLLEQVLDHLTRDDLTDAARRRAEAFAIDLVEPVPRLIFDVPLPTTPWLRQIADQLVASPADTRSVEEWAADAKVSTRTLTRRFPAETGLTFSEWRMRLRAHHAMQLLALGRSISFVARKTGFSFRKRVRCGFSSNDGRDTGGVCKPDRSSARANDRLATGLVRTATLSASIGLVPCRRMNLGLAKQSPCRSSACAQFDHFLSVPESSQRRRLPS